MWERLAQLSAVLSARPGLTLLVCWLAFLLGLLLGSIWWLVLLRRDEIRRDEERQRLNRQMQLRKLSPLAPGFPAKRVG